MLCHSQASVSTNLPSANACVLFPTVIKNKRLSLFRWGQASPDVLFEIAVLHVKEPNLSGAQAVVEHPALRRYQAVLTYGFVQRHMTAAVGDHASTLYGALESLLEVTANELADRKGHEAGFGDIEAENAKKSAGGMVAGGLFEQKKGVVGRMGGGRKKREVW